MSHEPTELAGIHEADTQHAYAWGEVCHDDVLDFPPTYPAPALTPRRVTALGVGASLVLVALAGVVALVAGGRPPVAPVAVQAAPPVVVTTTVTPPPTVTVTATPPPAPVTTVTVAPPAPRASAEAIRETCLAVMAMGVTPYPGPTGFEYASGIPGRHPGMTYAQAKALVTRAYESVQFHENPMCDGITIPADY